MRKLTHYLTPGLMAAALLLAPVMAKRAAAQDPAQTPTPATPAQTPAAAAGPTQQEKDCNDLYKKFSDLWQKKPAGSGQAEAYPIGQQYIEKCGTLTDDATVWLKRQVAKYEDAKLVYDFNQQLLKGIAASPDEVFRLGKQLIAKKPDDLGVIIALGFYGNKATADNNTAHKAEGISFSKQAIQLIDAGGAPADGKWLPFKDKSEALGWLNYYQGVALGTTAEAMPYIYRASQSSLTGMPVAFNLSLLAQAYDNAELAKAIDAFTPFRGQPVSPESEAALYKMNATIDRAMDLYARVINAATATDAVTKKIHDDSLARLTDLYKSRHPEDASGLNAFIANVSKSPMPDPKSPLPPPPPPATPAPTTGTTGGTTSAPPAGATPGTSMTGPKPPTTTGTPAPASPAPSPAPKPAAAKPPTRSRSHHGAH